MRVVLESLEGVVAVAALSLLCFTISHVRRALRVLFISDVLRRGQVACGEVAVTSEEVCVQRREPGKATQGVHPCHTRHKPAELQRGLHFEEAFASWERSSMLDGQHPSEADSKEEQ